MKKSMLKKTGIGFVLLIFLFTSIVSMAGLKLEVKAEAANFVLTHSYTNTLSQGDVFTLPLKMRATAGTTTISDIKLDFSNADIAGLTDGGTVFLSSTDVVDQTDMSIGNASMRFIGDGSSSIMPVTVTYKLNEETTTTTVTVNLFLNAEKPSDPEPSTPFDPTIRKPILQASLTGYDVVKAGASSTIHINLKNISTSTGAKNVTFIPIYEQTSPFIYSKATSTMPIKDIQASSAADMDISIDVDKFGREGTHPFTFKLTYTNSWKIEFTEEYTVYLKISNSLTNATLRIQIPENQSVTASAGGTFTLPLIIENYGSLSAEEVKVTVTDLTQETFTLSLGTGRYDFYKITSNEKKNITYTLKAASTLKSGSYPVTLKVEYLDEKGTKLTENLQVWIPVAGTEGQVSMLEVLEIKPSKTTVKPGESFDVTVSIKNSGEFEARQIKVSADGTTALLPVSQNLFIVPRLQKGETKSIVFKFQPQPEAVRGGVPITIKVESVEGGQNSAISRAISVFLDSTSDGKPEAGKNIPKIIVKTYSSEPTLVKAGEKFTLNLQFLNTHASKTVRNIKGNFVVTEASNETGSVFSPVDSSNTFYIDAISPKETCDWILTLYTIPDAKSKTYTVTISFEYEDVEGNPYKADEIIGIPVYQPSRFETSEFTLPPEAYMGQPVFFGFEMYNMGKTDIYNVKLIVEGDFEAQPKSNYFGNFESGRREYFELNLIPTMLGESKGSITFQYENASGEQQELVKEFSANVMEMMMPQEGEFPVDGKPMDPGGEEPQSKGFFGSIWFFLILGVVVVGGIVTTILVVRRRKKKEEFDF